MKHICYVLLLASTLMVAGCYHASVVTGKTPSAQVIDQPWALSFVYGLVPPSTVDASSQCSNGVAMVETELSFLNQVVSAVTFGILTPMHIKVTCAAGSSASLSAPHEQVRVPAGATEQEVIEAFEGAADKAVASQQSVLVQFE